MANMAASASKKQKLSDPNRSFNDAWTSEYLFILKADKTMCLICRDTVAAIKKNNVRRHFDAKHGREFNQMFPPDSEGRKAKIEALIAELDGQRDLMHRFTSVQTRATKASLHVSSIIAKSMIPYSHAEVLKECMVEAATIMFPNQDIADKMRAIPLSRRTCTRRIEDVNEDLCKQLMTKLNDAECYSLAVDESCDITDVAQMAVFVRFFNGEQFEEELLSLIELDGDTKGLTVYNSLSRKLDDLGLSLEKCISITTDGAPAMVGREQGLVARLKRDKGSLLSFHCIIHQSILCAKLSGDFQQLMVNMMKMINYLKSKSALRHRKLREFLDECAAQYTDLLTHNNVRWLSKGTALARVWKLREELTVFLGTCGESAEPHIDIMKSVEVMANLAFLVDIFDHLNKLNLKQQGKETSVIQLWSAVKSFSMQLELFKEDLTSDMSDFPTLKSFLQDRHHNVRKENYVTFIGKLQEEVQMRFGQFRDIEKIVELIKCPLHAEPNGDLEGLCWKCVQRSFNTHNATGIV